MLALILFYLHIAGRIGNSETRKSKTRQFPAHQCLLSATESKFSWLAKIKHLHNSDSMCIGVIVSPSALVMPAICVSRSDRDGEYFSGQELEVEAGGENGSCSQKRNGRIIENVFAIHPVVEEPQLMIGTRHGYMSSVTRLYVNNFAMDKVSSPLTLLSKMLPDSEEQGKEILHKHRVLSDQSNCSLPIVFDKNGKKTFDVVKVLATAESECTQAYCFNETKDCPDMQWSPETLECFAFWVEDPDTLKCDDAVTGSPLICEEKLLGFLKHCDGGKKPLLIQQMTREALKMMTTQAETMSQARWTLCPNMLTIASCSIAYQILTALMTENRFNLV